MILANAKGKIQTVLGLIDCERLGFTLIHEHLLSDFRCLMGASEQNSEKALNLLKDDKHLLIKEVARFRLAGGGAVVDVTPLPHLGRDPQGLVDISKETGVHIVMGVSFYTENYYGPCHSDINRMTAEELARVYIEEITTGVGGTGIKPGIIGEAGCSWPLTKNEEKCLHAASITQLETGLPISIHPGSHPKSPMQIMGILKSYGVEPSRIIMGHMEETIPPEEKDLRYELAAAGCYLAYDTFAVPERALPSFARELGDRGRISQIADLVGHGFSQQILISHDSLTNELMHINGGPGIIYIPKRVIPEMRLRDISEKDIHMITTDNPSRVLTIQ